MKLKEDIPAIGRLYIQLLDANGKVKESRDIPNLVVTYGLNLIAQRLVSGSSAVLSHMAVGTSNTPGPALTQTALQAQVNPRVALTSSIVTASSITYTTSFGAGTCTGLLTEVGLFNDTTLSQMFARSIFTAIDKTASDTLMVTWTITIG